MRNVFITAILVLCHLSVYPREMKDTVMTNSRDRLIITYSVVREGYKVNVVFKNVQKRLGRINGKKYKKLDELVVIFFDRTGNYHNAEFTDMVPEAFMIPSSVEYDKSDDGYFIIQGNDNPSMSFTVVGDAEINWDIPIYIAHYEGKEKYKLLSVSRGFSVRVDKIEKDKLSEKVSVQAITSTIETEGDNDVTTEILTSIGTVSALLEVQGRLPFSDGLQYEITRLRLIQDKVNDKELLTKIKETLTMCEIKKSELENASSEAASLAQAQAARKAEIAQQQALARQDSIQTVAQQQAAEEKKRNMWLIIGGVALAVVCVAGNQMLQHFRNLKNQKNMMEMQQSLAQKAEHEARRQVRDYAHDKTRQAMNDGKNMVKKRVSRLGNKPNGRFSI